VSGESVGGAASDSGSAVRFSLRDLEKDYEKTEEDIKAVQSVGQIIGEVMKQLDDERCEYL
jgi:26S proteasome regulatory subunit T4